MTENQISYPIYSSISISLVYYNERLLPARSNPMHYTYQISIDEELHVEWAMAVANARTNIDKNKCIKNERMNEQK